MSLFNFKEPVDLSGYTLIIPSVAVGNVPQLAIDLLISTLNLRSIATIWHPGIICSVGSDPFHQENTLCTACELYISETMKLAAVQLRSTIDIKLMKTFMTDFRNSLGLLNLAKVIILASGFDHGLYDIHEKDNIYFVTNITDEIKNIHARPLQKNAVNKYIVSGSGFAVKLYETLSEKITCLLLVKYVSEGDNIHDAEEFIIKTFKFIDVKENVQKLRFPSSWYYIYGAPPPAGLF